jgi:hypothetical protein
MPEIQLITTYYKDKEEQRAAEIDQSLWNNINNQYIHKIHLFAEHSPSFEGINKKKLQKVVLIPINNRPKFKDFFDYANTLSDEDIKVVANSDIYFDHTIQKIKACFKKFDIVTLSRWELDEKGHETLHNNFKSQDSWFFKKKIKDVGDYHIGKPGCDNKLLFEFKHLGMRDINPSLSIKSYHLHRSDFRAYHSDPKQMLPPPYAFNVCDFAPGSDKKSPKLLSYYYVSRYKFYKSLANGTLPGIKHNPIIKGIARVKEKYYAMRWKGLEKKILNS